MTRQVYDVPESEIEEQVKRVAEFGALLRAEGRQGRSWRPRDASTSSARSTASLSTAAQAQDQPLVLGSKDFIPGFEDQLIGVKAGDEKTVRP